MVAFNILRDRLEREHEITMSCIWQADCPAGKVEHYMLIGRRAQIKEIISGSAWGSMDITEPDAGTNAFRMKTLAKKDGDDYLITGQKVFITGADVADKLLLVCRTTSREDCEKQGLSILHAASASFRNESTVLFNEVPSLGLL